MDTIDKNLPGPSRPRRRLYSPDLKAKIIRECLRPGVSIAFIARQYDINDNLLHRWIRESKASGEALPKYLPDDTVEMAAFIPLRNRSPRSDGSGHPLSIEVKRGETIISMKLAVADLSLCASFLSEILNASN